MSDIVERLLERRGVLDGRWPGPTLMDEEAALEIGLLRKALKMIEYVSRKDSLTPDERLQSVRTVVCDAVSRINGVVGQQKVEKSNGDI